MKIAQETSLAPMVQLFPFSDPSWGTICDIVGMAIILDYNFKEALAGEHRLLSTFGFYPDRSSNLLKWQHLRKVLSIAVTVNLTTSILFVVDFSNLIAFTETAVFLPTQLGFIGKLTMLYLRKHLLFHIENMLQKPSFYGFTFKQLTRIRTNLQSTYTVTSYFRGFTVVYIIIAITFPLLQRNERVLPYNSWQPYDITQASYYYATFASQIVALIVTAFTNSSIDVVYYLSLNIACCQLDLLMDRLKGVDYSGSTKGIHNTLVKNLLHHYDIVEFVRIVDSLYSNIVFIQCTASVMVICFVGFQLMVVVPPFSVEFFWDSSYFTCMFIQIFFYCWYGHNVTAKSQDIGRAVYMSNFYVSDVNIRKSLIIFMERSKRPLILRCGFFTVSLATLTSILRSSYSYMAMLQQLYKE